MRYRGLLLAVVAALACATPAAFADGDPASDYLLQGLSFIPTDVKVDKSVAAGLDQMLAESKRKGFVIRVAIIATRYDLGAVPILFNKPQTYAKFLAQEDFFIWKDELLVVMPNGYGIYKAKNLPAADKALIARLPQLDTTNATELTVAAENAIRALAARRGITLTVTAASPHASTTTRDRIVIGVGVLLLICLSVGGRLAWRRRRGAR